VVEVDAVLAVAPALRLSHSECVQLGSTDGSKTEPHETRQRNDDASDLQELGWWS
jgi:hypothetical protein